MRSVQRLKPLGIYVQFFGDFVLGQYLHSVSREQPLRIGEVSCRTHIPGNLVSSGVAFARCLNLRDGNLIQISGGGRECRQTQVVLHRLKRDLITETSPWPALKLTKKRLRQRPRTWRSKRSLCAVKALNSRWACDGTSFIASARSVPPDGIPLGQGNRYARCCRLAEPGKAWHASGCASDVDS